MGPRLFGIARSRRILRRCGWWVMAGKERSIQKIIESIMASCCCILSAATAWSDLVPLRPACKDRQQLTHGITAELVAQQLTVAEILVPVASAKAVTCPVATQSTALVLARPKERFAGCWCRSLIYCTRQ